MNKPNNIKDSELLQDIYSNVKMGSDSIIKLLPKIKDENTDFLFDAILTLKTREE